MGLLFLARTAIRIKTSRITGRIFWMRRRRRKTFVVEEFRSGNDRK